MEWGKQLPLQVFESQRSPQNALVINACLDVWKSSGSDVGGGFVIKDHATAAAIEEDMTFARSPALASSRSNGDNLKRCCTSPSSKL
jgi:hypothetical protein